MKISDLEFPADEAARASTDKINQQRAPFLIFCAAEEFRTKQTEKSIMHVALCIYI